ncbi:hypothetical protein OROGR_023330 [Orobanche gracilis]
MAISRPFDMIKDLNDSKHLWKIVVRIADLWYIQMPPKPDHLEMILMDSKGDKIQVSIRKDDFTEWNGKLKEHHTYVMHNSHVVRNDLQYKTCEHAYRMQFTSGTTLKEKDLPDIPLYEFQFKSFSDILAGNCRTYLLVDSMGVVHEVNYSQPNANLKKVVFTMKDISGDLISCTLWEEHAIKFMNYCHSKPIDAPIIIILTHAWIKESQGKYPPSVSNSWYGSKLLINEDIPDIDKFKSSFDANQNCETSSQRLTQMSQYSQLFEQERFMYKAESKTIYEFNSLTSSEKLLVTVGTTVMFIIGKNGWYYEGCEKCYKKADLYKSEMKVVHKNGSGKFVFLDPQCVGMLGITTLGLKNQMRVEGEDDPKAFPLVLDMMLARTLALRVKVQPSYKQSSVINLSEDPNLIQVILDQLLIVEDTTSDIGKGKYVDNHSLHFETSFSGTADHDPDVLQAATPAKRVSIESAFDQEDSPQLHATQLSSTKVAKHMKQE